MNQANGILESPCFHGFPQFGSGQAMTLRLSPLFYNLLAITLRVKEEGKVPGLPGVQFRWRNL